MLSGAGRRRGYQHLKAIAEEYFKREGDKLLRRARRPRSSG